MAQNQYFVGLMSGTSADAIDAVLVQPGSPPQLIATHSKPLPPELRHQIHSLCLPGDNEIDRMGSLDVELGQQFALTVQQLLAKAKCPAAEVAAIGSHGQTIRHRPPHNKPIGSHAFSLQIGDPNTIAQLTGITTLADFRRRDMAAGGQGAPLVPAFHRAVFASAEQDSLIVNIGGMANLTWLATTGEVVGFDTGPGNVLMDAWIQRWQGLAFDRDGQWAASGQVHSQLLASLLEHPFFQLRAPKSTGREEFHLDWLDRCIHPLGDIAPADVQASLLALTATSIAREAHRLSQTRKRIIVCGGGAYNPALLKALAEALPGDTVCTSADLGIAPEWVEAMAFAWLAEQTLKRQPGNLCAVTGAAQEVILGGIYYA